MGAMLETERLIETAVRETGLGDFGIGEFRQGLEVLVADINRDHERPQSAVETNRAMIVKALVDRLKVVGAIAARPEVLDAPVERPVFVMGIPRTGTTLLNNLLAADRRRRSALKWELDDPVPPPRANELYSDPRALAALDAERRLLEANPAAGRTYRMSAVYPFECVSIFAHEFNTLAIECWGRIPGYRDFVFGSDWTSGYLYHKRFLQLHQADAPGVWNLKMPSHILAIDELLSVYPDARLIWTHRDPFKATASFCSIIAIGHSAFAGRIDHAWIAENCSWQASEHVRRGMAARERLGEDRIIDVHYADLMRDPIGSMRSLYAWLGDDFTPEAEAGMRSWLGANPQGKFGMHDYDLERYGLSRDALSHAFAPYLERYDIAREG